MTGHLDRYGEPLPIEDADDALTALSDALLDLAAEYVPRSPDEIRQHCAELRRILRESRAPSLRQVTPSSGADQEATR
jgi:hypothetical protein